MELPRPAVVVALLTPYGDGVAPDAGALRGHIDLLVEAGVDGLMPCGTTGEGPLLSDDEVAAVVRATVAAADGRVPVLAHVGRPGTAPTLALARRAVADGAVAVGAVVPYYYAAGDDEIRAHYDALIEATGAPVYAYTIPSHTHRELEPALLERLAARGGAGGQGPGRAGAGPRRAPGLAGAKDSTKSAERHREYQDAVAAAGAPFALFTGTSGLMLEALRGGSAGAVLALANMHPEPCVALARAVREGDDEQAERAQAEMAELEARLRAAGGIPAFKRAVADRLAERGAAYGAAVRGPLAAAAAAPAAG